MDPVGPWSAYASYNRLAGAQTGNPAGDLHHHLAATAAGGAAPPPPSTTTAQILPGSFLTPPPVAYETVFSPLFHAGAKPPAHYVAQHRNTKATESDYHQSPFFEQNWQQNSPFGILPHESVAAAAAATTKNAAYENFNAHFAAAQGLNHLNQQLVAAKVAAVNKTQSALQQPQQVATTTASSKTTNFYPQENPNNQSCIVTSPNARVFLNSGASANVNATASARLIQNNKQPSPSPTNKTNTKPEEQPISFTNYNNNNKRAFQHNYRYPSNEEFRPVTSSGPECNNVVVPRRPSPLQAHSQASPIGHAPSPGYPMYNSPMNSIASPQQSQQVTPPSPLDASVPRSQNNVAYPSVITRALNNTEKNFNAQAHPQTNCWEERQNRKYQYDNNESRQYFDNNLSSCRGDPMSIVKNLQQPPQIEVKQEVKVPVKRRKSNEKVNRIPPPAHSSASQQSPQQSQQNGSYFDFDRWTLPPTSKIFHHQQQQQQSPVVHHPPPPLPYFAPFLPHHPEFQSMDVNYENFPQTSAQQQQPHPQQHQHPPQQQVLQGDQPKVVVPNIEEELNFLSKGTVKSANNHNNNNNKSGNNGSKEKVTPGSGFMSSYLKFLQGERDSSPPPTSRYTSKKAQNWVQKKAEKPIEEPVKPKPKPPPPPPSKSTRLSQGDPQDDPRYFPLPKERKRDSFDSSDDGFDSDDGFFGHKKDHFTLKSAGKHPVKSKKSKGKSSSSSNSNNYENKRKKDSIKEAVEKRKDVEIENIPRRESVKRAAKERNNLRSLIKNNEDDVEEPPEFQDSDSDPAWTPQATEDGDDILPVQGKKKKSGRTRPKKRRNLITAAAQGAGIREVDGYNSDHNAKRTKKNKCAPTLEDNIAAAIPNNSLTTNEEFPYKTGEFVAIKAELSQNWPAIWRVDGKALLQKYEPFTQNGATLYKNMSTYTSWSTEGKKQYISIPIRIKSQSHGEVIVEFLKSEMTIIDEEHRDKCMRECEVHQDNFEVYIQTLISQALDSNFLTEIFQEKDEYFLSNVKTIDDITDNKKRKLLNLLKWPPPVQAAVCTWPLFNVIGEVTNADIHSKKCFACGRFDIAVRVLMYGQPYNSTTLEGCQPDPKAMNEKNFLMCRICATRIELANKVTHQKYLMYIECAKRVGEKRTSDPNKDTTCILNELLADENWLNRLFFEVRTSWAEIDCIEYSFKQKK